MSKNLKTVKGVEKLRLSEKNKYINEISLISKNIERAEKSNHDLTHNSVIKDSEFISKRISENNQKLVEWKQKIDELKQKIETIENGQLDSEIKQEISKNTQKIVKKQQDDKKKSENIEKKEEEKRKKSENIEKAERTEKYQQKQNYYEMIRDYDRFLTLEIPEYMKENLKTMPNNKGYIFKGNWFFGHLPPQNGPVVMFEKQRDAMIIHEIFNTEHYIYKKEGKNPKEHIKTIYKKERKLPIFF